MQIANLDATAHHGGGGGRTDEERGVSEEVKGGGDSYLNNCTLFRLGCQEDDSR